MTGKENPHNWSGQVAESATVTGRFFAANRQIYKNALPLMRIFNGRTFPDGYVHPVTGC